MTEAFPAPLGESRWPMAVAVLAAVALTVLLPPELRAVPVWVVPAFGGALLVALIIGDPGRISRRSRVLSTFGVQAAI